MRRLDRFSSDVRTLTEELSLIDFAAALIKGLCGISLRCPMHKLLSYHKSALQFLYPVREGSPDLLTNAEVPGPRTSSDRFIAEHDDAAATANS